MTPPSTLTASGTQLAGEREPDRLRHRDARLLLRLVGARTEVRRRHDLLQLEQRRVGARLLGEDVDARARAPDPREPPGQRLPRRRCHRGPR